MASSTPATSENVTVGWLPTSIRARLRPKLKVWLVLPWACRIMNSSTTPKKISGRKFSSTPKMLPRPLDPLTLIPAGTLTRSTPKRSIASTTLIPASLREVNVSPSVVVTVSLSPLTVIMSTVAVAGHLHHLVEPDLPGLADVAEQREEDGDHRYADQQVDEAVAHQAGAHCPSMLTQMDIPAQKETVA